MTEDFKSKLEEYRTELYDCAQIAYAAMRARVRTHPLMANVFEAVAKAGMEKPELFTAEVLKDVKGIAFVEMDERDIVRHKLVTRIVNAYHKYESEKKYPLFNENKAE